MLFIVINLSSNAQVTVYGKNKNNPDSVLSVKYYIFADTNNIGEKQILKYKNLESLEINEGNIPKSFYNLNKLKFILYNYNDSLSLSDDICKFEKLETLWTNGCLIYNEIPPCFFEMSNLKTLVLVKGWGITKIPQNIKKSRIEVLVLANTRITTIPNEFYKTISLKEICFYKSPIKNISKAIGLLHNLKKIDFSYTNIAEIPKTIEQLANLEVLELSYTKITTLPFDFTKFKKLKELYLLGLSLPEKQIKAIKQSIPKECILMH